MRPVNKHVANRVSVITAALGLMVAGKVVYEAK
jgi:hypothetical protein